MLLVPIHYPLKASSVQTLTHAIDFADQFDDTQIIILHVHLLHKSKNVTQTDLRHAIEEEVELPTHTSFHVRDTYLIENAILDEAGHQNADYVIIGKSMQPRWRQRLADYLGIGIDLESTLRHQLDAKLIII